jgi:hypothetical protein
VLSAGCIDAGGFAADDPVEDVEVVAVLLDEGAAGGLLGVEPGALREALAEFLAPHEGDGVAGLVSELGHAAVEVGVAIDETDLEEAVTLAGLGGDGVGVLDGGGDGLFEEDVAAGVEGGLCDFAVQEIGDGDNAGVGGLLAEELAVVCIDARGGGLPFDGVKGSLVGIRLGDGDDLAAGDAVKAAGVGASHVAHADDRQPDVLLGTQRILQ